MGCVSPAVRYSKCSVVCQLTVCGGVFFFVILPSTLTTARNKTAIRFNYQKCLIRPEMVRSLQRNELQLIPD